MSRRLLVLGYHNVEPTWAFPGRSAAAGVRGLDHQLRALRRWARVLPRAEALGALADGRPLPSRSVCLTFDDGYRDNVTVAAGLLARHDLPATFFLVPGFLSGDVRVWWEDLGRAVHLATAVELVWDGVRYDLSTAQQRGDCLAAVAERLKRLDQRSRSACVEEIVQRVAPQGRPAGHHDMFMDWTDAQRLLEAGFAVGSHTCGHPVLSRETADEQARELTGSKQELEQRLAVPVDVLAFPNGRAVDYDERTLSAVRAAGYRNALTTRTGWAASEHSPLEVHRVVIGPQTDLRSALRAGARAGRQRVRVLLPQRR